MSKFCLKVWGEFACFSRPEMKVERVSYDVITPSAARAIFESVFWKPPVQWRIEKMEVLKPIRWASVRRNEVSKIISTQNVQQAMRKGSGNLALYVEEERQQRAALVLKDVAYRLHAKMEILPDKLGPDETAAKFYAMFERRAKQGQCFHRPYLGCREFAADFALCDSDSWAQEPPIGGEPRSLGWMLYDLDFTNPSDPRPLFYNPSMEAGVIHVPERQSPEVRG
jgi:CRISPR-associated protein Cas5d